MTFQTIRAHRLLKALLLILIAIAPLKGNAMKPAPAPELDVRGIHGRFHLTSRKERFLFKATTELRNEAGDRLWKISGFLERWRWQLSPDGQFLLLFGCALFDGLVRLKPESEVLKIYVKGTLLKGLTLRELLGTDPASWVDSRKLKVLGGGWVPWRDLFGELKPDWEGRTLSIPIHGREALIVKF